MEKQKVSRTESLIKNGLIILVVVMVGFLVIGGTHTTPQTAPAVPVSTDHSTMAYVQAKNFVKMILKSPSSADFPYFGGSTKVANDTYQVDSYVDSQNSYGAMLRSNYSITLQYTGGDEADQSNWKVVELTFDGKQIIKK